MLLVLQSYKGSLTQRLALLGSVTRQMYVCVCVHVCMGMGPIAGARWGALPVSVGVIFLKRSACMAIARMSMGVSLFVFGVDEDWPLRFLPERPTGRCLPASCKRREEEGRVL